MEHNFDFDELLELATQHGIEISEEFEKRPKYLDAEKLVDSKIIYNMPNDIYHSHPESISSSTLKHATTPRLYSKYREEGFSIKNNTCLIIGTALHEILLEDKTRKLDYIIYDEEQLIDDVMALRPEVKSPKATKEWKELIAPYMKHDGSGHFLDNVLTIEQHRAVFNEACRLRKHPELMNLYKNASTEVSFFARFTDVHVRIRPDLFKIADEVDAQQFEDINVGDAIIISVKTTIDASPKGFLRECRKLDYLLAEAFYHDILSAVFNKKVHVLILAVEKDAKHLPTGQTMLYVCSENHINQGRSQYEDNLAVVLHCMNNESGTAQGYEFHNNNSIIMQLQ